MREGFLRDLLLTLVSWGGPDWNEGMNRSLAGNAMSPLVAPGLSGVESSRFVSSMMCLPGPFILEVYHFEKSAKKTKTAITKCNQKNKSNHKSKKDQKKAITNCSQKNKSNHKREKRKANNIASKNGTTQPGLSGALFGRVHVLARFLAHF